MRRVVYYMALVLAAVNLGLSVLFLVLSTWQVALMAFLTCATLYGVAVLMCVTDREFMRRVAELEAGGDNDYYLDLEGDDDETEDWLCKSHRRRG